MGQAEGATVLTTTSVVVAAALLGGQFALGVNGNMLGGLLFVMRLRTALGAEHPPGRGTVEVAA